MCRRSMLFEPHIYASYQHMLVGKFNLYVALPGCMNRWEKVVKYFINLFRLFGDEAAKNILMFIHHSR